MSKKNEVTCVQCPLACNITVETEGADTIIAISGNRCKLGEKYAEQEVISPMRILTTTVRLQTEDKVHPLLPVQTREPIPKGLLIDAMQELAGLIVKPPVKYGEVILHNILDTKVDIIANSDVAK